MTINITKILLVFLSLTIFSCIKINKENSKADDTTKTDNGIVLLKNDSIEIIDITKFEVEHPLWSDCFHRKYDNTSLDDMTRYSKSLHDSIESVVYSFKLLVINDKCLENKFKKDLNSNFDSLISSYYTYVSNARNLEELSFAGGKMSGLNSLDYEIYLTENLLNYLKYLTNTMYYAYLEPGVYPCD